MCRDKVNLQNEATALSATRRELSLRQHAAARALVRGYGSADVAKHIGVNRHTIGRWKRDARFIAELRRLRDALTQALVARPPPSPPRAARSAPSPALPSRPSPASARKVDRPMSDAEVRQTEAMINEMLAGGGPRGRK